jgi:hypothetical protein
VGFFLFLKASGTTHGFLSCDGMKPEMMFTNKKLKTTIAETRRFFFILM